MQPHRVTGLRIVASGVLFLSWSVCAHDAVVAGMAPVEMEQDELQVPFKEVNELGRVLDPGRLADLRGGEATVENLVDVDGSVDGNTANRIVSGSNAVADGAFNNASGINTVIQNTGSNVLIQNAMIVTVDFMDPIQ